MIQFRRVQARSQAVQTQLAAAAAELAELKAKQQKLEAEPQTARKDASTKNDVAEMFISEVRVLKAYAEDLFYKCSSLVTCMRALSIILSTSIGSTYCMPAALRLHQHDHVNSQDHKLLTGDVHKYSFELLQIWQVATSLGHTADSVSLP